MANLSSRDLLLEFIQWLADDLTSMEDLEDAIYHDDPLEAEVLIDEFLASVGE